MKLKTLSCDQASFKTLHFNTEGLTLIVGDSRDENEGSSNGVGKTLAMGLVHHCLGGSIGPKIKKAAPDWLFTLVFSIKNKDHVITRNGDGEILLLDETSIKPKELLAWLNDSGVFRVDGQIPGITFRSLFRRFARYEHEDCLDPLMTKKEKEVDGKLRSLYLLGLDCSLAVTKQKNKGDMTDANKAKKLWKSDHTLKNMFRTGINPKVRLNWLKNEIPRLMAALESYEVAENYRLLEIQSNDLTQTLREIEKQIAILDFQLDGIRKALEEHPDITAADLRAFYAGLENIFKEEALEHFENVERFHRELSSNRRQRLTKEQLEITSKKEQLEQERKQTSMQRDDYLKKLEGKKALDEYAAIAKNIAALEEEKERLNAFLSVEKDLSQRIQDIKERMVIDDRRTDEYLNSKPYDDLSRRFSDLAGMLYPNHPNGLEVENNKGDNQIRYNISVQIQGDGSDGINAARILCFDWLFYMHGANHTMDFLWHDNRMFAHMDPGARAKWFVFVLRSLKNTKKQYVASLNTENLKTMRPHMTPDEWKDLVSRINLKLHGDKPENKLLGIQFGME